MSEIVEEIEKIEEVAEKEQTDSAEELEQKKRNLNEFNAKENNAETQLFVQNLNYYVEKEKFVQEKKIDERTYDLESRKDCVEFIEKYKESEYLLVALVLCTFEFVTLGDLPNLRAELAVYLPKTEAQESEKDKKPFYQSNPYLSLDSIFAIIGAKQFTIEGGIRCAGFCKESNQALVNVWEQFPALREAIILWLIHLNETYEMNTALQTYQISTAFERIISLDITDSKMKIFPQLYENEKNVGLLGFLAYRLYYNNELKEEIVAIIKQWIKSDSKWLWKSACMAYYFFREDNEDFPHKKQLLNLIIIRLKHFEREDYGFVVTLLQKSKHFRGLFINALNEVQAMKGTKRSEKQIYINIIRRCYYKVNARNVELPLVCCDTELQQNRLTSLLKDIMSNYYLRKQLYAILKAYLKELSGYEISSKTVMHISAYFYNMTLAGIVYRRDVINFLKDCDTKVSKQIISILQDIYENEKGY